MQELKQVTWYYPAIKARNGKSIAEYDTKTVILCESNLFSKEHPVLIASDLHAQANAVIDQLSKCLNLDQFVVLTCGDMAGIKNMYGEDADPTNDYIKLAEASKEFYFVQGNHDLPNTVNSKETGIERKIVNKQDAICNISNGQIINTSIGHIGGINGTISFRPHPYKMPKDKYMDFLNKVLNKGSEILMTHEAPEIDRADITDSNDMSVVTDHPYVGTKDVYSAFLKGKVGIHIYGHCHHPTYYTKVDNKIFINADGRVLLIVPSGYDLNKILKYDFFD
jgi:Icc-related predicted phosphoesterase